ncbi:MAG: glycosyltransferase family 4 protein [Herpetosiphonaceae bacterium]|nr:glycosyltransferase family 4 protein [Herpetosiphonaceae bacterium]
MPRLLIISHDVVGQRMAGPGIRYWELAQLLATQQPVTLIAPHTIDLAAPGLRCGHYDWGDVASLALWLEQADVVFANGFVLVGHPELMHIPQPLALDLYDPTLLENLELFRTASAKQRTQQNRQDIQLLGQQLAGGDFFVCATERQRDLYLGALMGAGRITPEATDHDPQLRWLIDVVPFGLPDTPPVKQEPVLREVVPGIGPHDILLLWTGGLWDWLDPLTLVRAMPQVIAQQPHTRLVFLAGQHPGTIQPMQLPAATRALAAELGLLNTHIFFYEAWVLYAQRADFLLEADLAVSLHRNHLETAYAAVRSRFLDHLWAGLPSVVSAGDAVATLVQEHQLGLTVPPEDSAATAQAIITLLTDRTQRADCAHHARQLAPLWTWEHLVAPLARFCREPLRTRLTTALQHVATPPESPVPSFTEGLPLMQQQQTSVQQLEQFWQLTRPAPGSGIMTRVLWRITLRLAGPLLAQQQEFNAQVVKLAYASLTHDADTQAYLQAVLSQTLAVERSMARLQDYMEQLATNNTQLQSYVEDIERDLHGRLDTVSEFNGRIQTYAEAIKHDLHDRLDAIGEWNGQANDRIEHLAYTARLLNDAVAAADEAAVKLAVQLTRQALDRSTEHESMAK